MSITIAICDDEKNIRNEIMRLVKNQCDDCRVDLYNSGDELLTEGTQYDIYFLDIQMPGLNGIETAELLREKQEFQSKSESVIIFVTALKEYMEAAFDVKAFHYLIKPIDKTKFINVFSKAMADCKKTKANADKHILVKSGNSYHKIFLNDIYYVESRDKKITINSTNGAIEHYGKIQEIESILGESFFRCHRCYLVNMGHVTKYNSSTIWLNNGDAIFLAQKKYNEFVKAYMMFAKDGGLISGSNF